MDYSLLVVLAFCLDAVLGDPGWLPHPIRLIGRTIERGEQFLRRGPSSPQRDMALGGLLVIGVVSGTFLLSWMLLHFFMVCSWWLGSAVSLLLGSLCLARRSLKEHALAVLLPLQAGDLGAAGDLRQAGNLGQARRMLARIVSRETQELDEAGVVRGTLESVGENSSDGVVAPLLYLALGGVPLALAYKAINTLDSMVGYRNERYEYFGKAAARLDDIVNFLPARLTALAIIAAAWLLRWVGREYDGSAAWRITWRDGHKHASPNAGYPEAALAGALGVQLGGSSRYFGRTFDKPTVGEPSPSLPPALISQSLILIDAASVVSVSICVVLLLLF